MRKWAEENGQKGVALSFELQQDGAPAHFAERTLEYLEEQGVDFWDKGKWPGNSADLSPIENIWGMLKAWLEERDEPKTMIGLKRLVTTFFKKFPVETCKKLLDGMPRRFQVLRDNKFYGIGQ